jgi:nucleoside 2-deoxyribosyltransferase
MKVYLAGPLGFTEVGSAFHKRHILPLLRKLGHQPLDPWAGQQVAAAVFKLPFGIKRKKAWEKLNLKIGRRNQRLIDRCDLILAVLDGSDVDSGTAAEVGYGFAKGKPILGYRGDFRLCGDNEGCVVNLQVEYFIRASGGDIINKIAKLPLAIKTLAIKKSFCLEQFRA